ncbi:hypothetical protein A3709_19860 [Halioglobus sp. HI00S01]|uniref:hypothetical protein n=1 Tax=Halioglobus sp. HI00S01 TaxID=1822214 RepID=UPI0007C2BD0A|nr:hypothetical protein [Halioglobus sp. HI00S01]KZX57881.1 hypothetical protein A3709_19860 [Halioglobus sp. HI00S01]
MTVAILKTNASKHSYHRPLAHIFTFDTCQGEERDVVFYSMVATRSMDRLNYIFPKDLRVSEDELDGKLKFQRLNVGSRAAKQQTRAALEKNDQVRQAEVIAVREEAAQARKLLEDQLGAAEAREVEQRKTIAELSRALGQQRRKQDGRGDSDSHPHSGAEAEE